MFSVLLLRKTLDLVCLFENLLWSRGSLGPNTDDSCWKLFFCQSLYPFSAKAIMTIIHGLQAYATHTICSNFKVFQLQYKFKLTVRTYRLNKICDANLLWYAKYSECIAKYIWAWKFLISHRQWSWNGLMALQIFKNLFMLSVRISS